MQIIILGAGQVGSSLARLLSKDIKNHITLVDSNLDNLEELKEKLDIRTVHGKASHPNVLQDAGAASCDIIIAVTTNDEINILAAEIARNLYKVPTTLARVRETAYSDKRSLFEKTQHKADGGFQINVLIAPESQVSEHIFNLIEFPNAKTVVSFANQQIKLAAIEAEKHCSMIGHKLADISQVLPALNLRVAAIYRNQQALVPDGKTIIKEGDEVLFIASSKFIRAVLHHFRPTEQVAKRITIAGGGNIGRLLAKRLEKTAQVRIIEQNLEVCHQLSVELQNTLVVNGDSTDQQLLLDEMVDKSDVFCAVTNNDESNVLSSLLAKSIGVARVITLVGKDTYRELADVGLMSLDHIVAPQEITLSSILAYIRPGDVAKVHTLHSGTAEALEIVLHGSAASSQIIGKPASTIPVPHGTTICAVLRDGEVLIVHNDTVLQEHDHVIVFVNNIKIINELEQLFHVY